MRGSDDRRAALRSAICDGDGRRVVIALSKGLLGDLLQLAGDGLLVALAQGVEGGPDVARRCADELRGRAWAGDDDLADQLDAALSNRPAPMLRPLPVDPEELAGILEGDPAQGGGRIDLRTGEVWPRAATDYAREVGEEDPDDADAAGRMKAASVKGGSSAGLARWGLAPDASDLVQVFLFEGDVDQAWTEAKAGRMLVAPMARARASP